MRFNLESTTKAQAPQPKKQSQRVPPISRDHSSLYVATSIVFSVLATPPYNLEVLGFIALVGLIKASVEAPDRKKAFAYGLIYGALSTWAINLWVLNLSVIGWLAACWVGIFPAIFSTLINKSKINILSPIWWSSCWVLVEAIRATLIPFGWNPLSSMTSNVYLIQNAAWGCSYTISFVLCLSSATVALILMRANLRSKVFSLALSISILTTLLFFGYNRLKNIEELRKEDIEQIPMTIMSSKEPFTPTLEGRWTILENHIRRTKEAKSPYLNIWPESIGFALLSHQPSWDAITTLANEVPGPLLLTPSYPYENKIYNSSILLENQAREAQIYKKRFLTPIGEYIPSFVPKSLVYSQRHPGDQSGDLTMLVTDNAGTRPYRIGMLICLEEAISKAAKQSLAQGAEIFISPSNHGDTGKDCALQQERMGQLRAVETCTPLVRVGNIGASNIFDFAGREIFRNEGEKMSNVQVPILKDRSKIFPNIYLKTQEAMLWIFISIFAIGLFSNLAHKKVDIAPEKN